MPQPPDQKTGNTPDSCSSYAKNCYFLLSHLILLFRTPLVLSAHLHAGQRRTSIRRINRAGYTNALGQIPVLDRE